MQNDLKLKKTWNRYNLVRGKAQQETTLSALRFNQSLYLIAVSISIFLRYPQTLQIKPVSLSQTAIAEGAGSLEYLLCFTIQKQCLLFTEIANWETCCPPECFHGSSFAKDCFKAHAWHVFNMTVSILDFQKRGVLGSRAAGHFAWKQSWPLRGNRMVMKHAPVLFVHKASREYTFSTKKRAEKNLFPLYLLPSTVGVGGGGHAAWQVPQELQCDI